MKVAVLLALALFASASLIATTSSASPRNLYNVSNSFVECDNPSSQPLGDPVEGGGVPHPK